ncbi:T9SS type A sorting domain-containing protein [Flavobacterium sp. CYK-4]|uniref:T9SS type A sorting domain-containing protein n=1 Tax=Flavobacterium lotistagni TaxID=2709660 RepID=UPI00140D2F0D|nr:T9SS type A sorting domain-containing protein [Flavobacterium lotistagni]NHM06823.1 T9SS type A sorting domain-containing protein [Flavobacterium lotistagni]
MKKLLLSFMVLAGFQNMAAQTVLYSENFDAMPVGNIGTDITGATASNGFYTLSTNYDLDPAAATTGTNASNNNFQVIASTTNQGNVFQIEGTNGDKGRRNMWFDGFSDQWIFRGEGNDILEIEFDLYTGNTSGTSLNTKGVYIYDPTAGKVLGGYVFNTKTLVISGIAYYTSATAPIGNYLFFLGTGATNIVLPADSWVRLGVSFNKTTGTVRWKGPNINGQVVGAATGTEPDRVAIVSRSGTTTTAPVQTNTAAAVGLFDNIIVRATATDGLLGVDEVVLVQNTDFMIQPNPANNVINIAGNGSALIREVALTDVNGRVVKSQTFNNTTDLEMNISDLASGMYLVKITSDQGASIKKILKN